MVVALKTDTLVSLADYVRLAKRIESGAHNNRALMQFGLVSALSHIETHGNVNVLEPLAHAVLSLRSNTLTKAWKGWVVAHSWLTFNPQNLKGKALASARFSDLWVKDKTREMHVDAARESHWWEYKAPSEEAEAKDFDVEKAIAALVTRINKALEDGKAIGTNKKAIEPIVIRSALKIAAENIAYKRKPIEAPVSKVAKARNKAKAKIAKAKAGLITADEVPVLAAKAA